MSTALEVILFATQNSCCNNRIKKWSKFQTLFTVRSFALIEEELFLLWRLEREIEMTYERCWDCIFRRHQCTSYLLIFWHNCKFEDFVFWMNISLDSPVHFDHNKFAVKTRCFNTSQVGKGFFAEWISIDLRIYTVTITECLTGRLAMSWKLESVAETWSMWGPS